MIDLFFRKDDEVRITRGKFKGREGKVTACYRRRWAIHVDKIVCDKANAQSVPIPLDPSNVVIVKLQLDKDRKALMARKEAGKMPKV
jgi:large subunit ribosomal protein L26e